MLDQHNRIIDENTGFTRSTLSPANLPTRLQASLAKLPELKRTSGEFPLPARCGRASPGHACASHPSACAACRQVSSHRRPTHRHIPAHDIRPPPVHESKHPAPCQCLSVAAGLQGAATEILLAGVATTQRTLQPGHRYIAVPDAVFHCPIQLPASGCRLWSR